MFSGRELDLVGDLGYTEYFSQKLGSEVMKSLTSSEDIKTNKFVYIHANKLENIYYLV
jgi:hypothetical protein